MTVALDRLTPIQGTTMHYPFPREFRPSEKHARTYKSVENLKKALDKREWSHNLRYLVYRFESGRVTAVFYGRHSLSAINDKWPVVG